MSIYYINEAAFDLPDVGFIDRTVTSFEIITPSNRAHSLTVNRSPIPDDRDLGALVDANVRDADRRLRGHKVLFRRELEIGSCPAIEIAAEWRGKMAGVYTRQAHLDADGCWLVFAGSAPLDDRAACDEIMDHVLSTLRLRDRGAGASPAVADRQPLDDG
jgi:hypothetical protein